MPVVPFVDARKPCKQARGAGRIDEPADRGGVGECDQIRPGRCNAPASADMVVDDDHIPLRTTVRDLSPAMHEGGANDQLANAGFAAWFGVSTELMVSLGHGT